LATRINILAAAIAENGEGNGRMWANEQDEDRKPIALNACSFPCPASR
jgi:hypothetical protein